MKEYTRIKVSLNSLCEKLNTNKKYINIVSINDLINVPLNSGVYWIETTMPVTVLHQARVSILNNPKLRYITDANLLVHQANNNYYLAYLGTEKNLRSRLEQHLFNTKNVSRLGCDLNQQPFSNFSWRIWYVEIQDETIRYAVESWWLHNKERPPFCLRIN
jgi:hypothetical protein